MKRIIIKTIAAAALAPIFCGCTSNFEDYNTNPYQPHDLNPPMLYTTMITSGVNVQQNDNQMIDQMVGGPFGGYLSMSQDWGRVNNFYTYNADDNWNQIPFNTPFEKFYANYYRIQEATGEKGHFWAMAKLLRVNTMHRVTDAYGPIPYSQVSKGVAATPYDSQEDVYKHMFEDLDYAINILKEYVTETGGMKPLEGYDPVFNGDYSKWVRFANSMKLRLALRISSADPVLAQKKAEEAVEEAVEQMKEAEIKEAEVKAEEPEADRDTEKEPEYTAWSDRRTVLEQKSEKKEEQEDPETAGSRQEDSEPVVSDAEEYYRKQAEKESEEE